MANNDPGQGFLVTEKLVKRFDEALAVDDVSLSIGRGEIFALLGSSGCGKSTLLRMLAGFEKPTSGRVLLGGQDVAQFPPYDRPMNMMFQSYALFPHLDIWENVAFGLKREGLPKAEIRQRVGEMLDLVQLGPFAKRKPHQLSGGQQQRVALARSLAKRPKLLLLDEPLSALDRKLREEMQLELRRLQHEVGITFLIVTHDQEEALGMASDIAVMQEGRILQVASPRDLYEHPRKRFVAEFIGMSNGFDCTVLSIEGERATVESPLLGRIGVERADPSTTDGVLIIRPEKIRLDFSTPAPQPGEVVLDAVIEQITYFGDLSFVYLRLADGRRISCSRYNVCRTGPPDPAPGTACRIGLHPDDMLLVGD